MKLTNKVPSGKEPGVNSDIDCNILDMNEGEEAKSEDRDGSEGEENSINVVIHVRFFT